MSDRRNFDSDWDYTDSMQPKRQPYREDDDADYYD